MSEKEASEVNDDWNRYSENMRPTRKGRKIEALKKKNEFDENQAKTKLDELLKSLPQKDDELTAIFEFCSWFEQNYPFGCHKLYYELLWKIVSRDGFIQKYSEDDRMLKIWDRMADNSAGHAHDIYHFAISRGSLIRNASLYVRWAECVELAGAIVEARRVLILARTNRATPLELINNAEDQFEMRQMRRHLNQQSSESDEDTVEMEEETRQAFTNLPVIGRNHAVPVVRIPSLVADTTKKALKFDNSERIQIGASSSQAQPFEVLEHTDSEDVEYLKSVHDLMPQIERFSIKEAANQNIKAMTSESTSDAFRIRPIGEDVEIWTDDAPIEVAKPKLKLVIKQIFRDMSFEEYAASLPNHPSMTGKIVKKLDFDAVL